MGSPLRVLMVEDSRADAELLRLELERGGYAPVVERVDTPEAMKEALKRQTWDIILSDYMMPRFSGPAALKVAQEVASHLPFIIVTGQVGEEMAVAAMKAGAHDYILKGNLTRLVPAIRRELQQAVVRRERREADEALREANAALERRVEERAAALVEANRQLAVRIADQQQAEEALRRSETNYRELVQNANSAIIRWRSDGRITFVNEYAREFFGWGPDEVLGQHVGIVLPAQESTGADLTGLVQNIVDHPERNVSNVNENVRSDGRRAWMAWTNRAIRDERGQVAEILSIGSDITEQKRAEATASALIKYAPTGIYEMDYRDPRITSVNDAMCRLTGYSREELLATNPAELLDGEGRKLFADRVRRQMAGEAIDETVDFRVRKKDGSFIYVTLNVAVSQEKPHTTLVIAHDVTDRRRTEEELRESQRKVSEILESVSDGFFSLDADWTFGYMNPRAAETVGYEPSQLLGKGIWEVFPKLKGSEMEHVFRKVMADRKPGHFEHQGVVTDKVYQMNVYPSGESGISVYWVDITERQQAEAERERLLERLREANERLITMNIEAQEAREMAERAVKARDEFISIAAHELKTPLTSLKGFAQLLLRQAGRTEGHPDVERVLRAARRVDEQSKRLGKLTDQLLDLSRLEKGKLALERAEMDLGTMVKDAVMGLRRSHPERTIEVQGRQEIRIWADALRLEQVVVNLIDNALKFSPSGGPVGVEVGLGGEGWARIAVRDHGIGIPAEEREHVFEQFYQAHAEHYYGGMGIGLFLSQQIVELHGGTIALEQPEDGGSCFVVRLPISSGEEMDRKGSSHE